MARFKILKRFFKSTMKEMEQRVVLPTPIPVGYYNGECPECKAHIGIYVFKQFYGRVRRRFRHIATCPVCKKPIFKKLDIKKVELGRL